MHLSVLELCVLCVLCGLIIPMQPELISSDNKATRYKEKRWLIHCLPTSPAMSATHQSAAVIAAWAIALGKMRKCDRLSSILDTQIAAVVDRLEASPRCVQVRDLGYRWGSCGHKGDLYFHWRVAMLPRVMIEYLAIHEMVHLIEPHHNHAFWDRVEQILPDFEKRKRWLAENAVNYDL